MYFLFHPELYHWQVHPDVAIISVPLTLVMWALAVSGVFEMLAAFFRVCANLAGSGYGMSGDGDLDEDTFDLVAPAERTPKPTKVVDKVAAIDKVAMAHGKLGQEIETQRRLIATQTKQRRLEEQARMQEQLHLLQMQLDFHQKAMEEADARSGAEDEEEDEAEDAVPSEGEGYQEEAAESYGRPEQEGDIERGESPKQVAQPKRNSLGALSKSGRPASQALSAYDS